MGRGRIGWCDGDPFQLAGVIDGANRNDIRLLEPTLAAVADNKLLEDIETLHLNRGYDYPVARDRLAALGLHDVCIQRRGTKTPGTQQPTHLVATRATVRLSKGVMVLGLRLVHVCVLWFGLVGSGWLVG